MKSNTSGRVRSIFVHLVLIFLSFLCLFFFYILIVNATRSHADLQKGFSALPGKYFLENLKNVANDGSFPMFRGILNSVVVSSCSAALCTYFSSLTAYGLYAYDFKMKKAAFTFIMAILVMPTQVTAMGFLRLITKMGMYDSLLPLIIPSIASPAVFYFMYSYLQSSLPHETGSSSTGNLYFRRILEQLLRSCPDHSVKEQNDSADPDCNSAWC